MTPENQKQLAKEFRLLARRYCDGEYSKMEYRRRRRSLLDKCEAGEAPVSPSERTIPAAPAAEIPTTTTVVSKWVPYAMVGGAAIVLGVMAYLLRGMP